MTRHANRDRDEQARRAADEIMHAERTERAEKTARLREARLARDASAKTEAAKPAPSRRRK